MKGQHKQARQTLQSARNPNVRAFQASKPLKKAPEKRRKRVVEETCVLDDVDCPIVSEMEHFVGYCLCHLCKCGAHVCPASTKKNPKTHWPASTYQIDFHRQLPSDFLRSFNGAPIVYRSLRPANALLTTHRAEFQGESPLTPQKNEPKAVEIKLLEFKGRTSLYKREFPGWNVDEVVKYEAPLQYHPMGMQQPQFVTSYQDTYRPPLPQREIRRASYSQKWATREFFGETTNKTSFQDRSSDAQLMNQPVNCKTSYLKKVHARPFTSVYQADYRPNAPKRFPRMKHTLSQ